MANYANQIERARGPFYKSAEKITARMLKAYRDELMLEVNKANTTQEINFAASKPLKKDKTEAALLAIYETTMPTFAGIAIKQIENLKAFKPPTAEMDYWHQYIQGKVKPILGDRITWITETTAGLFKETAKQVTADGLKNGWSIDKMADQLMTELEFTEEYRAERIARTEVVSASNAGSLAGALKTGLDVNKKWIAYIDKKTRDSHREADDKDVPIKQPFMIGKADGTQEPMMHPGDMTASAGNVINCRCAIGYKINYKPIAGVAPPTSSKPPKPAPKPKPAKPAKPAPEPEIETGMPYTNANGNTVTFSKEAATEAQQAWIDGGYITGTQENDIKEYTGGFHEIVNDYLRFGKQPEVEGYDNRTVYGQIQNINRALNNAPMYEGQTYRGQRYKSTEQQDFLDFVEKTAPGRIYTDKGFLSTSYSKDVAADFAGKASVAPYQVFITVNGKTGVPIDLISVYGQKEQEVLFNARSSWMVQEQKITKGSNGTTLVEIIMNQIIKP